MTAVFLDYQNIIVLVYLLIYARQRFGLQRMLPRLMQGCGCLLMFSLVCMLALMFKLGMHTSCCGSVVFGFVLHQRVKTPN